MFRHLVRPVTRITKSGTRSFEIPHDVRPPHMDELPLPNGSWQEAYDKAQKRYNLQLAAGIAILTGTIAFGRSTGYLWLNYRPPVPKE